jgi:hypothetical protein
MITSIGIDAGSSGAMAALYPDSTWEAHPVLAAYGKETFLDVHGNLRLLEAMIARAGGMDKAQISYERGRKNKGFGSCNNFTIGRHDEFWRVLFEAKGIPASPVFPRTWQDPCLGRGGSVDTKERALNYVRSRCSDLAWLDKFNKVQREGIVDAMCIALWAKDAAEAPQPAVAGLPT